MDELQKILIKKEAQRRKKNMKLYPLYMMFGYDLMFYYAINILFLSEIKHVSDAHIMLLSSMYALSSVILILPISAITSKIRTKKAMMCGNLLNAISTLCIIIGNTYIVFILSQVLSAIAFAFINISVSPMLKETIPQSKEKNKIFGNVYSKSFFRYCIFAALSTIASGYLYKIDPYIPMFLCVLSSILGFVIASNFVQFKKEEKEITLKESFIQLKDVVIFGAKSKRLKALLLALGLIWGILVTFTTYSVTLLKNLEVSPEYIGIILALLEILKGRFSERANAFHDKHRNTSISKILYIISISYIIIGMIANIQIPLVLKISMIIILFFVIRGMHGIYAILYNRYLNNFMQTKVLPSIYSLQSIVDNIFRGVITCIASGVLTLTNIQYATLIMGILFVVLSSIVTGYMRDRIGLNPLEYDSTDTKYASNERNTIKYEETKKINQ